MTRLCVVTMSWGVLFGWVGESPDGLLCFFLQDKVKAAFKRGWIAGQKKIKSEDGENRGWGKLGE